MLKKLTQEHLRILGDRDSLPRSLTVNRKLYVPQGVLGAGRFGVVWHVTDEWSRARAAKLTFHDESYLAELSLAAKLEPYNEFAHFFDAGIATFEPEISGGPFLCVIEEFVDGIPLSKFLKSQVPAVTVTFFKAYLKILCNALSALSAQGLKHADLHLKNVIIASPPKADLSSDYRVKIVDTGNLVPLYDVTPTARLHSADDHLRFVEHLVAIWNVIYSKRILKNEDRQYLRNVVPLIRSMLDEDHTVALRDPHQIIALFTDAYTRAMSVRTKRERRLSSPFEFISAEHIADDRVLLSIFADSCPWLEKIATRDPCLLSGPRGCGKSTIFRWLSLKAHLHKEDVSDIEALPIAGFYVSCSTDLQNRISWIKTDELATQHQHQIIHYFNLLLAREVVHTLHLISRRADRESLWYLGESQERGIYEKVVQLLSLQLQTRLQGTSRLEQLLELIEDEMFRTHVDMLRGRDTPSCSPETFLGDLTVHLGETMPIFADNKKITFLVDDYSTHRIPDSVQRILNRVIWERRDSHIFKLSSEKFGAVLSDPSNAMVDPAREMVPVDVGSEYLALDDKDEAARALRFTTDLLDRRLAAAKYKGTAEILIGRSSWPGGSLARALLDKQPGRLQSQYHGLECIAQLCSGDVSTLLYIVRKIFDDGGVNPRTLVAVKPSIQHNAIRDVSRQLLSHIRLAFPYGPEMYAVVNAFGTLVRNILEEGRHMKKGDGSVPDQCPRIEIDQEAGAAFAFLAEEQQKLAKEILRKAIFIDMNPGSSRHDNTTTMRWHLRRIYLPAFGAALAKNDAVKRKAEWLQLFLERPAEACDLVWRTWAKTEGPTLFTEIEESPTQ